MKNIIITGASSGIGYSTAKRLSSLGHTLIAIARSETKLDTLIKDSPGSNLYKIVADLSKDESIEIIKNELSHIDRVDVIINNAGYLLNKPFFETTLEEWNYQLQVNLMGSIRVLHACKNKLFSRAHIVNIGSMGGFQGSDKFPGLAAYSTSKGALHTLTESLSKELSPSNISVNCLALGAVQTEMLEEAFPGYVAPVNAEKMGNFIADFALNSGSLINGKIIPISLNNPD